MAGNRDIQPIRQELPKFLKDLKARTGQSESPDINTKRKLSDNESYVDDEDRPDEAPLVCIPDSVATCDAKDFIKQKYGDQPVNTESNKRPHSDDEEDGEEANDGKLKFKKPTQKSAKKNKKKKKSQMKQVKNANLLSFDDKDEEDDT